MAENEIIDTRLSSEELFNLLLNLLETTTPYKHEQRIRDLLPENMFIDKCGNAWCIIPKEDGTASETLFCCHMDTVGFSPENTDPFYHKGYIYAMSNKSSCLGGDDRCGVLCLIAMMNAKIPGTYLFHVGEEKGTIGASFVAKTYEVKHFKRAIEFDRRGTTSIITVMMGSTRVCSETFANALAKQLNEAGTNLEYKPDDTGLYTDVVEYCEDIPECTNLSVGYQHEHSNNEKINADWLISQFIPALYKVKWEELPAERDPKGDNSTYKTGNSTRFHRKNNTVDYGDFWNHNRVTSGTSTKGGTSSSKKSDSSAEIGNDYIGHYNSEHGFDDDDEISSIDGLSVFDEKDFFDSCNFCGERGDAIAEYFFEGKFWELCESCKDFLQLEDSLKKDNSKEKEIEVVEKSSEEDTTKATTKTDSSSSVEEPGNSNYTPSGLSMDDSSNRDDTGHFMD